MMGHGIGSTKKSMWRITMNNECHTFSTITFKGEKMNELKRAFAAVMTLSMMVLGFILAGCGGGGGAVSSQVVSGTAAVGTPLSGQVSLKDSSTPALQKTTAISSDGSFAIDVTSMKAPFVLQAAGSANGTVYKLHSFAEETGTANINPLSDVIVASAAGVDNPADVFEKSDSDRNHKIKTNFAKTISTILAKLQPLLKQYNAENTNPITARYIANHLGLDDMFDNVKITVSNGTLSIINTKTEAVIFSGKVVDIANGIFNGGALPPAAAAPTAPTAVTAVGGTGQVTLSWGAVATASSYNIYYATTTGVTKTSGTKITSASTPYIQTGLTAGTTYYYIVTALNSTGESVDSAQSSATTASTQPVPTVPAAPTAVTATGGTNQVTIAWGVVNSASSYNIYYATTSGVTKATGTKITNATTPTVQIGLAAGTTYYYIVTAVNSTGESAASVQTAATTLTSVPTPTAPVAPVGVTAVGSSNQATISWPAVSGATSYNIYYATTTGVTTTSGAKITNAASPYVQTGLAAGTTYYYTLTAVNTAGESVASAQATATTTPSAPVLDGAALYNTNCAGCHGAGKRGKTLAAIQGAIASNRGGMSFLSTLSVAELTAISLY